jgi:hypothetical protein
MLGRPVTDSDPRSYEVGPFFTAGVLVLAYGLARRKGLAIAAGLGAIWIDQRTELGRGLKRRLRRAMKEQIKAHARDGEPEAPRSSAEQQAADERA